MNGIIPLLTYVFVVSFTPGPNNILSMTNGMRYGYRNILRFIGGILCGFAIIALSAGMLNLFMANLVPASGKWLKILAAVYMFYLAYRILRSGPMNDEAGDNSTNRFWFGFTMQFMNVKAILFAISVFSLFVNDFSSDFFMVVLFAFFLVFVTFMGTSLWALGGTLFRSLAQKYYKVFNAIMGGLLIYTGIAGLF